ncbi:unnamed protein product [Gordionus sp. m RMFG-2023]|uniref:U5 small nuclear ribonucleoprotein 40 kDa protein-like n=1 Tax=Gordionus sp. m RMFG-2023 TaxID=3053472 RepID=UPI0030E388D6
MVGSIPYTTSNLNTSLILKPPEKSKHKSDLSSPIILYTGHESEIYSIKFSSDGTYFASGGFERQIFLWNTFDNHDNFAVIPGHLGAILDINFNTDGDLVSCSSDKFVCLWDMHSGTRIRKFRGHTSHVNSCACNRRGPQMICSGSDDSTVKLWDSRRKNELSSFQNTYQILAVEFSDNSEYIFSAGIDNVIKVWDIRKNKELYTMFGHTDSITGLRLSPDGNFLLTNSMDNTVRIWDVRPYAPSDRCCKVLFGHQHNYEKNLLRCDWSKPSASNRHQRVTAGSSDRFLYVWDTMSGKIIYKLPGHTGSVNETTFHPNQDIIASCSSDKKIFLGEI